MTTDDKGEREPIEARSAYAMPLVDLMLHSAAPYTGVRDRAILLGGWAAGAGAMLMRFEAGVPVSEIHKELLAMAAVVCDAALKVRAHD